MSSRPIFFTLSSPFPSRFLHQKVAQVLDKMWALVLSSIGARGGERGVVTRVSDFVELVESRGPAAFQVRGWREGDHFLP